MKNSFFSLPAILQDFAYRQPDKTTYVFLEDGEAESVRYTYQELDKRAKSVAAYLQACDLKPGSAVMLLYPSDLEFVAAFLGCLYAGMIAVPAQLPGPNKPLDKLEGIVRNAQVQHVLTDTKALASLRRKAGSEPLFEGILQCQTDTLAVSLSDCYTDRIHTFQASDLAFLQYTSGSTGEPKGVMVSHGNIIANTFAIHEAFGTQHDSVGVGWLPFHHDMGLIGNLLSPLVIGMECVLMPPLAFLQMPVRWLKAISRYQATASGGPNFAYDLCTRRISDEEIAALDLRSWKVAFNGAEPVQARVLREFSQKFAPAGFSASSFFSCYGMAETTLLVTGEYYTGQPETVHSQILETENQVVRCTPEAADAREYEGCGDVFDDQQVRIVDPTTCQTLPNDQVGEIWVSGSSIAQGYWNQPELTQHTFQAYTTDGEGPFLRTGDLGFWANNRLFVTGRIKDLLIVRGRNYYPQDIESTIEDTDSSIRAGGVAVFSVSLPDGEHVVAVAEIERTALSTLVVPEVCAAIRQSVARQHDLELYAVLLIKPMTLPRTTSGKLQRFVCRKSFLEETFAVVGEWRQTAEALSEAASVPTLSSEISSNEHHFSAPAIREWLTGQLARRLKIDRNHIAADAPLDTLGLTSLTAVELSGELSLWLRRDVSPTVVYDYPTLTQLVAHLAGETPVPEEYRETTPALDDDLIAIVGMQCRFPGAVHIDAYRELLQTGTQAYTKPLAERWPLSALYTDGHPVSEALQKGGFLDDVAGFDAAFFGISPREATAMDPQQRLWLEVCWEALENAGIVPATLAGRQVGVFAGASSSDYAWLHQQVVPSVEPHSGTGNALSIIANRLSYLLDLRGPSMAIDTACSSSLVAVHQACQSLRRGETELALAGGVNILLNPAVSAIFDQAGMLARDARCKVFDASADGYVRGEGCGVVVLQRLSDAVRQGNTVYAILKGSAVNQDGRSNGLTAPNGPAQQAVIREALQQAGTGIHQIGYFELHGTGTSLGDPIEVNSLVSLLKERTSADTPRMGSVKANIGHLESAAGIAGLLKAVLCVYHAEIPLQPAFSKLNPQIHLKETIRIPLQTEPWTTPSGQPRLASVSSFGFGGTNAHIIVEQAPAQAVVLPENVLPDRSHHLLTLSAKDETALRELVKTYHHWLEKQTKKQDFQTLADIAFSANTTRSHFAHRAAFVAKDYATLVQELTRFLGKPAEQPSVTAPKPTQAPSVAMLFTGQGSQYAHMGQQLFETQVVFRQNMLACEKWVEEQFGYSLLEVLYGSKTTDLNQTQYAQLAIFSVEYSLYHFWQSVGIEPSVLIGHSIGEYVAACVAGIFTLKEAVYLVGMRGKLMQALPQAGKMMACTASVEQIQPYLKGKEAVLSIAAVNAADQVVVSGDAAAVEQLYRELKASGISSSYLSVSHAFHSPLMRPMLAEFAEVCEKIHYQPAQLPIISTVSGELQTGQMSQANYWTRQITAPVLFEKAVQSLRPTPLLVALEIGSKPILTALGQRSASTMLWLSSLRQGQSDWQPVLVTLAALYEQGIPLDWKGYEAGFVRKRLPLPTYPFQHKKYWVDTRSLSGITLPNDLQATQASPLEGVQDALYTVRWEDKPLENSALSPTSWLIWMDTQGMGEQLAARLENLPDMQVVRVYTGETYEAISAHTYRINPAHSSDYQKLAADLSLKRIWVQRVVYVAGYSVAEEGPAEVLLAYQTYQCSHLLYLLQQVLPTLKRLSHLYLLTPHCQSVTGGDAPAHPASATVWGLGKTIALEYPEWQTILLDTDATTTIAQLLPDLTSTDTERQIAWRNGQRKVARLVPQPLVSQAADVPLDANGVYLITGGYGALGQEVTRWLVAKGARHIVWTGRKGISDAIQQQIDSHARKGVSLTVVQADSAQISDMQHVLAAIPQTGKTLKGIVHAAGVLEDGILQNLRPEAFQRVLQPKLAGAWNLHQLTRDLPLDFFVLFSSAAALLGSPAQANYAAANAFLDALADYRRQRHLAAVSIQWGPWEGEGMAAASHQLTAAGFKKITPAQGMQALEHILRIGVSRVAFLPLEKEKVVQWAGNDLFLQALLSQGGVSEKTTPESATWVQQLAQESPSVRIDRMQAWLCNELAQTLRLPDANAIDRHLGFAEMGMDSMLAVELKNRLQQTLGVTLPMTALFNYATIDALSRHLVNDILVWETETYTAEPASPGPVVMPSDVHEPIAIIGTGCRFPGGVYDLETFWNLLIGGKNAIREVPVQRWDLRDYYDPTPGTPGKTYTRHGGFVENVDAFDADFFGISPREAQSMDPQHRILLEVSWEALENAGIRPADLQASQTGIFLGIGPNEYAQLLAQDDMNAVDTYVGTGNGTCFSAGRLSYLLGLQGPSMAIDTACSSSLVSLHLACQSLRSGECDLALAGGVQLMVSPATTIFLSKSQALSPDGQCKTFSDDANGYVRGEGCGMVVLKRLRDALRDDDPILAVIRGSAINHDGRSSGLTVPNGNAQAAVIAKALQQAQVQPHEISYVEAHGTGTSLGDPIEIEALGETLTTDRNATHPLYVGSVKTNVGHLEAAAGIAGLLKVVAALQHQQIPPHLNLTTPNAHVDWNRWPIRIPTQPTNWQPVDGKRMAGVSSFGLSGTNAHIIIEQAPAQEIVQPENVLPDRSHHLLTLSAKDETALRELVKTYHHWLEKQTDKADFAPLADIAFSANTTRSHFAHRAAFVAKDYATLVQELTRFLGKPAGQPSVTAPKPTQAPSVAMLFTGQGSQYAHMGQQLFETQVVFRQNMLACEKWVEEQFGYSLLEVLYGEKTTDLNQTQYAQLAIFSVEYSLYHFWQSVGIEPSVLIGHSIGEYVAACVAGIFTLKEAVYLVGMRGKLMQALPQAGKMMACTASVEQIQPYLKEKEDKLSIAAVNAADQVVVSGEGKEIEGLVEILKKQGIRSSYLSVSHAFHSPLMRPMLAEFAEVCEKIHYQPAQLRIISTVSGELQTGQMSQANYWVEQITAPVLFEKAVQSLKKTPLLAKESLSRSSGRLGVVETLGVGNMLQNPTTLTTPPYGHPSLPVRQAGLKKGGKLLTPLLVALEIGSKPILTALGQRSASKLLWLSSLRQGQSDWQPVLVTLAALYEQGIPLDWKGYEAGFVRKRLPLPTYPFQHKKYWVEPKKTVLKTNHPANGHATLLDWLAEGNTAAVLEQLTKSGGISAEKQAVLPELLKLLVPDKKATFDVPTDWQYKLRWQKAAETEESIPTVGSSNATWVLLADQTGMAAHLTTLFSLSNEPYILIETGDWFAHPDAQTFILNPNDADHLARLLQTLSQETATTYTFLCLWGIDSQPTHTTTLETLATDQVKMALPLLRLVQAFRQAPSLEAKLWIVTRQAVQIQANEPLTSVSASLLWGLGKSIALEYPHLWGGLLDIDEASAWPQVLACTRQPSAEFQKAIRQQQAWVPRLVRSEALSREPFQVSPEAWYLVTGGLGNLGQHICNWLIEKGVRYLAIVGRTGVTSRTQPLVQAWEAAGATVRVFAADVASHADMQTVREQLASRPLKGIIHAAGLTGFDLLADMQPETFSTMTQAKVAGSWVLHEVSKDMPLDFFVGFSSIASVWGSKGQGHYAAGNQFLDTLCHYRHSLGLPATSINWGLWEDTRPEKVAEQNLLAQAGIQVMPPTQALAALETVLSQPQPQSIVAQIDWAVLKPLFQAIGHDTLLSEIADEKTDLQNLPSEEPIFLQTLEKVPVYKRKDQLVAFLQQEIAAVLKRDANNLPPVDRGFFEMGFDSLMALELKNRLEKQLACTLPTTVGFDFPTIRDLSGYLMEQILSLDFTGQPGPEDHTRTDGPASSAPDMDTLSGDDVRRLLEEELKKHS